MSISSLSFRSIFLFLIVAFFIGCASEAKIIKGVIEEPTVNIVKRSGSEPGRSIQKKLPLSLWESYKITVLVLNGEDRAPAKVDFCEITGINAPLETGTEVQVIEEAPCLWVLHKIDGKSSRYNISLSKVKVIETGQTGWVWSKAVNTK